MIRRWLPLALAPLLWGCAQDPTIPKVGEEPVILSMTFSSTSFRQGKADTITVTAQSVLDYDATIQFASDCQLQLTIRNTGGSAVVPPNGQPSCLPIPSQLVIPAGASVKQRFVWNGADHFTPPGSSTMLPPGTYYVSASIKAINYSTVAPAVIVELVAP